MTKKYTTTIETEWEVRGDVSVDQINARIKRAMEVLMLTEEGDDGQFAFRGENDDLKMNTVEKKACQ